MIKGNKPTKQQLERKRWQDRVTIAANKILVGYNNGIIDSKFWDRVRYVEQSIRDGVADTEFGLPAISVWEDVYTAIRSARRGYGG